MTDFNKNLILSDKAFEFPSFIDEDNTSEIEMLENYFKGTVFSSKCKMFPKFTENIIKLAETNNLDPQLLANVVLSQTADLKKKPSMEDVMKCFSFQQSGNIGIQLSMQAKMLQRFYETAVPGKRVNVMDDEQVFPANQATAAMYQVIPFVGEKDLHTYDRTADKEGNIIEVKNVLKKKAPFGMYKFWLNIEEYDMKGLKNDA